MNGDVHGTHGDPFTEHWNVAPDWLDSNVNVALNAPVTAGGPVRIVVSGSPRVVHVWDAGVWSTLGISARSMARTSKVCAPCSRPTSSSTASVVSHGPPSSENSNSSTGSLLAKPKNTSGPELPTGGAATMNVSGGVVSAGPMISHSRKSGVGSTVPAGVTARTSITCGPPVRPVTVYGDGQSTNSALSSEHWKSVTGSPVSSTSPTNSNVASVTSVSESGPASIEVSGAERSVVVHVCVAGVGSMFPTWSMAATSRVCSPAVVTTMSSGDEQPPMFTPSSQHWKSISSGAVWSSTPVNSNQWIQFTVSAGAPLVMVVSGGVVSVPSTTSHS